MKSEKVIVIGAGSMGEALADMLAAEDYDVVLVENDEERAKAIANKTDCLVIKGDATDLSTLKDAGIDEASSIIIATRDDKTNLMICEIAKNEKVAKVISRVNLPGNEELFINLGITSIVPIMSMALTSIKRHLQGKGETVVAELGGGKIELMEIKLSDKSPYTGKAITSLKDAVVCSIYRNGELLIPNTRMKFKEGDVIVVASTAKDTNKIMKAISKE
ncbi:hypothetical protein COV93_05720 [Candidatus Woesearchaeota archaeon CG11_big_fil_rev_8_21_14_0_20_43_8]|nr:MAG: hypothetical protein COV93_05720 [Candidatus Woesearchaeota archaeon CG11_big_fil_rev_8_21_14_0_20_43_8]